MALYLLFINSCIVGNGSKGNSDRAYPIVKGSIMAFVISQPCIDTPHQECERACIYACPVDCIYEAENTALTPSEQQDMLYIHPIECIHCRACEPACPVEAIFSEEDVPVKWAEFIQVNEDAFEIAPGIPSCPYGRACPYVPIDQRGSVRLRCGEEGCG